MSARASVLGCPVDLLTRAEVLTWVEAALGKTDLLHLITLNPEQVMAARANPATRSLISGSEIVTIDGVGISLALKAQGKSPVERLTGVELVREITERGYPAFLLGGRAGSAESAQANLQREYRTARIVGAWSGGRSSYNDDQQSLDRIAASGAQVVLVAFGSPAQLEWIERNRIALERIGVRVAIGVGGALDYYAGLASQPPEWARKLGIEWLVRLVREPWRWRRQLVLPVFACLAMVEAIQVRLGRS